MRNCALTIAAAQFATVGSARKLRDSAHALPDEAKKVAELVSTTDKCVTYETLKLVLMGTDNHQVRINVELMTGELSFPDFQVDRCGACSPLHYPGEGL